MRWRDCKVGNGILPDHLELTGNQILRIGKYISGLGLLVCGLQAIFPDIDGTGLPLEVRLAQWVSSDTPQLGEIYDDDTFVSDVAAVPSRRLSTSSSSSQSSVSHASACWTQGHEPHKLNETLAFVFFCFVGCNLFHHLNLALFTDAWRFPISVVMFLLGMLIGVFFQYRSNDEWWKTITLHSLKTMANGMKDTQYFDPHALLYIVLPPLLYESASSMSWHTVSKILPSAILLAVPGVMLNTFFTGFYVRLVIRMDGKAPSWSASWLLSAILSATDPVAVVSALSALGAPAKLNYLVEGESLLNDGSAVVLVYILQEWVMFDSSEGLSNSEQQCPGNADNIDYGCVFLYFLRVAAGGALLGLAAGAMLYQWVKRARSQHAEELEIGIVLTFVYTTFYVAEALKTSGVLAVVMLGFCMTITISARLSPHAKHSHHCILHQIAYVCNQVTFFSAGIISARFMWGNTPCTHTLWEFRPWCELAGLYIFCHLTRSMVIMTFWPVLKRLGYGINWKEACIMVWGGLRGAVGLIMGLIIEHDKHIDHKVKQMIVFHTAGIVLLTLFVNGQTIDGLYKRLDLYPVNAFREAHLRRILEQVENEAQKQGIRVITKDWFFKDCCFKVLLRCMPNFRFLEFDEANNPEPVGIETVYATLKHLESYAYAYRGAMLKAMREAGITEQERLGQRREEDNAIFLQKMTSKSEVSFKRDQITGVHASVDRLIFNSTIPNPNSVCGLYVSAFSLKYVVKDDDFLSFEVELLQHDGLHIIVGFLADDINVREDTSPTDECQLLGITENSFGFDCALGKVSFTGPFSDKAEKLDVRPMKVGDKLQLLVEKHSSKWEIEVHVIHNQEDTIVKRIVLGAFKDNDDDANADVWGPFTPEQLYPAVEFRPSAALHKKISKGIGSSTSSSRTNINGGESGVHKIAADSLSAVKTGVGGIFASGRQAIEAMGAGVVAGKALITGEEAVYDNTTEVTPPHTLSPPRPQLERESTRSFPDEGSGKVHLSFETHPATDTDSVVEVFHVFFNMLQNHYSDMHENGVLCDKALFWLLAASSDAIDCANHEVNCKHPWSFLGQGSQESDELFTAKSGLFGVIQSFRSGGTAARLMKANTAKLSNDSNLGLEALYGPVILEYLVLREHVHETCWVDKLPPSWRRIRSMGYYVTRSKVEALWAFIEAHEKILDSSPAMERFPQLVECVRETVSSARKDLSAIADCMPGRFFYTKHLLVLRTLLNKRLKKMHKFVTGGSLSKGDGALLEHFLLERLVTVDLFTPRSLKVFDPSQHKMPDPKHDKAWAWANLELPDQPDYMGRHFEMVMARYHGSLRSSDSLGTDKSSSQDKAETLIPIGEDPREHQRQSTEGLRASAASADARSSPIPADSLPVPIVENRVASPSIESVVYGEAAARTSADDNSGPDLSASPTDHDAIHEAFQSDDEPTSQLKSLVDNVDKGSTAGWTPQSLEDAEPK